MALSVGSAPRISRHNRHPSCVKVLGLVLQGLRFSEQYRLVVVVQRTPVNACLHVRREKESLPVFVFAALVCVETTADVRALLG